MAYRILLWTTTLLVFSVVVQEVCCASKKKEVKTSRNHDSKKKLLIDYFEGLAKEDNKYDELRKLFDDNEKTAEEEINKHVAKHSVVVRHRHKRSANHHWSYECTTGPEHWKKHYPNCGFKSQSPINLGIRSNHTITETIDFSQYSIGPDSNVEFTLINNGHTVEVALKEGSDPIKISGGGLPGTYTLRQFHIHWGENDKVGSEHALRGHFFPMELHFVHYNSDLFASIAEAHSSGQDAAIAVVGVFVKISDNANSVFDAITDHLSEVIHPGTTTDLGAIDLSKALPDVTSSFFRYNGSLTIPPCTEGILWTVIKDSYITIRSDQLKKFRSDIYEHDLNMLKPMTFNHRPLQGLHGRQVFTTV